MQMIVVTRTQNLNLEEKDFGEAMSACMHAAAVLLVGPPPATLTPKQELMIHHQTPLL